MALYRHVDYNHKLGRFFLKRHRPPKCGSLSSRRLTCFFPAPRIIHLTSNLEFHVYTTAQPEPLIQILLYKAAHFIPYDASHSRQPPKCTCAATRSAPDFQSRIFHQPARNCNDEPRCAWTCQPRPADTSLFVACGSPRCVLSSRSAIRQRLAARMGCSKRAGSSCGVTKPGHRSP